MTSHARWWHTARAAGFIDGVRIIVTLTEEGRQEGRSRERRRIAVDVGCGKAERGVQAGGRRPEVSASRQLSEGASVRADKASEQARSPHEWLGCRTGATCAVVGVGACSRPAAAFSRCPFSPRHGGPLLLPPARTVPPRVPPMYRATSAAATYHPSDSVGREHNPSCLLGRGEPAGPQL